ncbi:MAG TPA: hypothetical protein VMB91_08145 [Solirubrobacteraceae bacterium]|nr:hypothetical protein [Solirubrobacteraceae bacterium]
MTRKGATLPLTLAAALGLAGCGGSGSPTSQSTPATTPVTVAKVAASPHAQFVAFADHINLKPQDLAGFATKPEHEKQGSGLAKGLAGKAQLERCLGSGKEAKPLFKSSSATFQQKDGAIGFVTAKSQVEVIPTRTAAEKELTLARRVLGSPAKLRCFTSAFDAMLGGSRDTHTDGHTVKITFGRVRAAPVQLAPATSGTAGGYGLTLTVPVTYSVVVRGHTVKVPAALYWDSLNFILGRAGVGLTTMGFGAPFPSGREADLFSLLVGRARQASRRAPAIDD